LFSAAVPGQTGDGHVNEQWPDYWIDKFKQQGYSFADIIRPAVWENEDVLWWYAQNTFLFFRDGFFDEKGVELPVPANKPVFPLKCLHPECFEMISSALSAVSGASGFGGGILTAYIKSLLPVLAVRGYILYGAGRHTEWFLGLCEDFGLQKPECVIDDRAAGQAGLAGITVKPPDQCIVRNKWIVLSSDVPETAGKMLENLIAAGYDSRFIVDLYSNFPSGPYLKE
jgi:hypothetical protein